MPSSGAVRVASIGLIAAIAAACPAQDDGWIGVAAFDPQSSDQAFAPGPVQATGPVPWAVGVHSQAAEGSCTARPDGGAAWSFRFNGRQGIEFAELVCDLPWNDGTAALAWDIDRIDGDLGPVNDFATGIRVIDASGETLQYPARLERIAGRLRAVAVAANPEAAWGGNADRRIDPPARLHSIGVRRPGDGPSAAAMELGPPVALVRRPPAAPGTGRILVEVRSPRLGNCYPLGATAELRARIGEGSLAWRLEDGFGARLAAGGGTARVDLCIPADRPGLRTLVLDWTADGLPRRREWRMLVLPARGGLDDSVGVCTHFGRVGPDRGDGGRWPPEALPLVTALGVGWIREGIPQWDTQHAPGVFGFSTRPDWHPQRSDWFLQAARDLGLRTMFVLRGPPRHGGRGPIDPQLRREFADWAAWIAAVTPQADAYEIWNEWSLGGAMATEPGFPSEGRGARGNSPQAYAAMAAEVGAALRLVRPDASLIGIGGENPFPWADQQHIREMIRAGATAALDGASVHPYRYPVSPERSGILDASAGVAAELRAAGHRDRIWISEFGYHTARTADGCGEDVQACHLVRTLALLRASPEVERAFIYDLLDKSADPDDREMNFGLFKHGTQGLMPKASAATLAAWTALTGGLRCLGRTGVDGAWAVRFRGADGHEVVAAWSASGPRPVATVVGGRIGSACDAMGAPLAEAPAQLGAWPVYLLGRDLALAAGR